MVMAFSCNKDGEECCGTDSYFPCDGRWSIETCINKSYEYFYKKTLNRPYGFKVCVGTILYHRPISELIEL